MTNAETAKRLREIANREKPPHRQTRRDLNAIADELDPPRPEPGTVVWFRTRPDNPWVIGVTLPYGITPANNIAACWNWDSDGVEWKPARILANDEVAVRVPKVSEWPETAIEVWLAWHDENDEVCQPGISITRDEAERMERER